MKAFKIELPQNATIIVKLESISDSISLFLELEHLNVNIFDHDSVAETNYEEDELVIMLYENTHISDKFDLIFQVILEYCSEFKIKKEASPF